MNPGRLCVSVCAPTVDELIASIRRAEGFADIIEIRFDCLSADEFDLQTTEWRSVWKRIVDSTKKPIVSTFRPASDGGRRTLTLDERCTFWNSGCETEFCDIEDLDLIGKGRWTSGKRILSLHDFGVDPVDPGKIFDRLADADPDVTKIAMTASDITDAVPVWQLHERSRARGKAIVPIAMGEAGKWTRILGLAHGAFLTYASLDKGEETADGQITARDMLEVYRVKDLDRETKVYGVIGDPVSSSLSPYIHNPAFVEAGENAVFLPLQLKDLDTFVHRMVKPATREVELNFAGFAVTLPHKQAIISHLDDIDSIAKAIGAVNTVKIDPDGRMTGYNTDAEGFIAPLLERSGDLTDATIAVIGSGGAARAVVFSLRRENAAVTVFARDVRRAARFADEFNLNVLPTSDLKFQISNFDIVVNATPMGMLGPSEHETPLTAEQLLGVRFVYDLVTRSGDTPLVAEAKRAGIPAIGGLEMLLSQAAKQFEIWTGLEAPVEAMLRCVQGRIEV